MREQHNPRSDRDPIPNPRRRQPAGVRRTPPNRSRPEIRIDTALQTWVADGRAQGFSECSLVHRERSLARFIWWLEQVEQVPPTLEAITAERTRRFLAYCRAPQPSGRFGCARPTSIRAARPSTVATYFRDLRSFTNFCRREELLVGDPLKNVRSPKIPEDQIVPLIEKQVQALLRATTETCSPERNRAIILILLDSGLRVSELCSLTVRDADTVEGALSVLGKGGKRRNTYLGTTSRRALKRYLLRYRAEADPEDPLFIATGGTHPGAGLTRFGVLQFLRECGQLAGLEGVRCTPHTLRHTFAISFLRGGGNVLELQRLLGHNDLTMVRRYVRLGEVDLAKAHRQASPADRMKL